MRISDWSSDVCSSDLVVLDEVSQVSTRDAAAILRSVTAAPGAQLWCLGDADQGRSVKPGGLAAELVRLDQAGEVAARSEERRVGKECVSTCRSRWSTYHKKQKNSNNTNNHKQQ